VVTAATKLAVNVEEAAALMTLAESRVWEEIAANRLRSFKVGRRRLVRVVDIEAYLERRVLLEQGVTPRGRR
jgi:excisionase family DNA binding protein